MLAANMYASDQNDLLPGCGWGTTDACWAHGANLPTYGNATSQTFPADLANQVTYCRLGELFPYLKTEKLFVCPAAKTASLFYQRNVYFTSYVWNGAVCGYGPPGGNARAGTAPRSYKLTQFKPLSILQWEADEKTPFFFNDCSSYPDEGISGRHGKGATVGLVSGTTQRIRLALYYTQQYAGPPGQNPHGSGMQAGSTPNQMWCDPGTLNMTSPGLP